MPVNFELKVLWFLKVFEVFKYLWKHSLSVFRVYNCQKIRVVLLGTSYFKGGLNWKLEFEIDEINPFNRNKYIIERVL